MDASSAGGGENSFGGGGGRGGSRQPVEMDLQALMMGSESLLTHIARPDGIPRLDKSLAEIVSAYLPCALPPSSHSISLSGYLWSQCRSSLCCVVGLTSVIAGRGCCCCKSKRSAVFAACSPVDLVYGPRLNLTATDWSMIEG